MRKLGMTLGLILLLPFVIVAQSWTFTKADSEYSVDLPSHHWHVISRVDVHEHEDFAYEDNGLAAYLRVTKRIVEPGTTPANLFARDEKWGLQHLPGYTACTACQGETIQGALKGSVFSYEFVRDGVVTAGRVYYLQSEPGSFYTLRFTVRHDGLKTLQEQMDMIARTFRIVS